ncbi:MAG: ribonuclease P protein component [Candidatus Zambryskibacteria bacterium]|nr:ribonuclease P protein component [Candidatus Zambryskibacteria bacterium]
MAFFQDKKLLLAKELSETEEEKDALAYQFNSTYSPQVMNHFYLRTAPADKTQLIISVSKKVSKKAVVRNKIKRRVRAIMQKNLTNIKPARYFVVAKTGAEDIKSEELKSELLSLIRSIRN